MTPFDERDTPGATRPASALRVDEGRAVDVRGCGLGEAVGRRFVCEEACAFWETGGAVAPPGCLLGRVPLDLVRQPEAAHLLVDLKERLEHSQSVRDRQAAHARLAALLAAALQDGVSRE